jgi:hypothetical protein
MREKGALYYFGIPIEVFDANYEKISSLIEGCILRSNMGATADIDFEDLLKKFEEYNNPSPSPTIDNNNFSNNKKATTTPLIKKINK